MIIKENTCCFTGHREISLENQALLKATLTKQIEQLVSLGYTNFVAGGAIGFDTEAALTVLELKATYPIFLHLILPCPEQDKAWSAAQKETYRKILSLADSAEYVCEHYTRYCMAARNRKMVDMSSAVIAYFNGENKGGTAMTLNFANRKNLTVYNIF